MHAKMEVNFVIMKFTPVSGHNGDESKKLKIKFFAILAINVGCFINIFSVLLKVMFC